MRIEKEVGRAHHGVMVQWLVTLPVVLVMRHSSRVQSHPFPLFCSSFELLRILPPRYFLSSCCYHPIDRSLPPTRSLLAHRPLGSIAFSNSPPSLSLPPLRSTGGTCQSLIALLPLSPPMSFPSCMDQASYLSVNRCDRCALFIFPVRMSARW